MLGIQKLEHLAANIGLTKGDLLLAAEYGSQDIRELTLWHPDPRKKSRDVIAVGGTLRRIQSRLYDRVFRTRLKPSPFSHGGVPQRHPLSNAREHFSSEFALSIDVADFYPSLSNARVNRLFLHRLGCSPEVARVLTRICTYEFHLALGLVTSPILSDQIMHPIDSRIAKVCKKEKLRFSRFVDDITISGTYDLEQAGIPSLLRQILSDHGLRINDKTQFGRMSNGFEITGIRLNRGHADVGRKYMKELERLLDDHHSLAADGPFQGPLMTSSQLEGKVHAACWVNPGRRIPLLRKLRSIHWDQAFSVAEIRGLVRLVKRLAPRGAQRPSHVVEIGNPSGTNAYRRFRESGDYDQRVAPF